MSETSEIDYQDRAMRLSKEIAKKHHAEVERLKTVNAALVKALRAAIDHLDTFSPSQRLELFEQLQAALALDEGKGS